VGYYTHNNEEALSMDYQHTVLALVRRKENCLIMKHKGPQETSWWLPGGVEEPGEELISALLRELLEEN
jgi:8-oxo-dGTP diphosphatase